MIFEGTPILFRAHHINLNPIYYRDTPRFRFDSDRGTYKVLYAGLEPECAFIETFGWITGKRRITTSELSTRALAELRAESPLRLIDLCASGGLARVGADAELISTRDYVHSRQWAEALHIHPIQADGILYPARHDPVLRAVALFDRAPKLVLLNDEPFMSVGEGRARLAEYLRRYKFHLVETRYELQRNKPRRITQADLFR